MEKAQNGTEGRRLPQVNAGIMGGAVVLLLSGGINSTALLARYLNYRGDDLYGETRGPREVYAFTLDYGQRHSREVDVAREVWNAFELPPSRHRILYDPHLAGFFPRSTQVDRTIELPLVHYTDDLMARTMVANLQPILVNLAAIYARSVGAQAVVTGVHAGGVSPFRDCPPEILSVQDRSLDLSCGLNLFAPYAGTPKPMVVRDGTNYDAPFHLTYSCYSGERDHCGACGPCMERREAFKVADIQDPTLYEDLPPLEPKL